MVYAEQQLDEDIIATRLGFRSVYQTPAGQKVLAHDILQAGLFAELKNDEDVMRHNVLIQRLDDMGVLDEEMVPSFVKWLLNQPANYRRLVKNEEDDV
jgi:hypothetical protein